MFADTELEAEVEPSLETEQRLAAEEAAREEAARKHKAELERTAQEALAQAAEAERQRAQQEADLERLRQVRPISPYVYCGIGTPKTWRKRRSRRRPRLRGKAQRGAKLKRLQQVDALRHCHSAELFIISQERLLTEGMCH